MQRRSFLKGVISSTALPVVLVAPNRADAFVVTLAAVSQVASIGASVLGFFGKSSNPTPQLVLENYNLLLGVHEKLDGLEVLIIEVLKKVNAIPALLQEEINAGAERSTNKDILAIVRSHEEALQVFETAKANGNSDAAYPILISSAEQNYTSIQNLRNTLSFYSAYSLMAIAASSVTELSLYVLQGGDPSSYGAIRRFNKTLLERHEDTNIEGSLAHDLAGIQSSYESALQTVRNYVQNFPPENGATILLNDGDHHLQRCTTYGYPERPWGQVVGGQNPFGYLNLNRLFRRHEENLDRAKDRNFDRRSFTNSFVTASQITVGVNTFTAGDQVLPLLNVPERPEVLFSGGAFEGFDCDSSRIIGRPNVNDRQYQEHIGILHQRVEDYNNLAEAFGVMLEYRKQVQHTFAVLDEYLAELGVPE